MVSKLEKEPDHLKKVEFSGNPFYLKYSPN